MPAKKELIRKTNVNFAENCFFQRYLHCSQNCIFLTAQIDMN